MLAVATVPTASAAELLSADVPVEVWDRPRSGRTLLGVPAFRRTIAELSSNAQARLLIRHPAGSEGVAQAEELKAWLVAHAIGPERIALRADLPARQPLRLDVTNGPLSGGAP